MGRVDLLPATQGRATHLPLARTWQHQPTKCPPLWCL